MNNIRKSDAKDIDRILEIWHSSVLDTYEFIKPEHWDEISHKVKEKFLNSDIYVYEEKLIKGFILIDNGYIDELYIKKEYRSNGIGKKLIDYVKNQYDELSLNIFQKNSRGISFYLKNGFKIVEENVEDFTNEKGYYMLWKK